MDWKKTLVFGSIAAGAALFMSGRKPAGLAVAGIGVAVFASQNPEKLEEIWNRMPEYVEKGSRVVDIAAGFLERFSPRGGYRNVSAAGGNRY
ncbi:MAG TPA: hypothetical protein VKZ53_14720 [Candidatus Angelobacter sp.]|nr:hypothetical protein [Candidatus Angelobacter sp.]